jgi:hypothetical protein
MFAHPNDQKPANAIGNCRANKYTDQNGQLSRVKWIDSQIGLSDPGEEDLLPLGLYPCRFQAGLAEAN